MAPVKRLSHAKRRDENELEIVHALEQIGCHVTRLDDPFDLLVGYRGRDFKMEVKMPRGTLTDDQVDYIADNRGAPLHVVTTVDQAIAVVSRETEVAA